MPGIGVVAVLAAQQTAGQKSDEADAWAVDRATHLPGVHVADDVVAFRNLLDVAGLHVEVVALLIWRRPRNVKGVATPDQRLAHIDAWNVRLSTSSCCSLVSLMKFTA
jgi:hypothetical protein